jgi:hypothetical protein
MVMVEAIETEATGTMIEDMEVEEAGEAMTITVAEVAAEEVAMIETAVETTSQGEEAEVDMTETMVQMKVEISVAVLEGAVEEAVHQEETMLGMLVTKQITVLV